jgi:tetrahydromethanopterin S-methyltransferase subunit F
MSSTRFKAMPRFVVAIVGHLFLFAWFRELALWSGLEREAWKAFRIGAVAAIVLVCATWIVIRGTQQQKIAGAVLCVLPAFCLISALLSCWSNL